MTKSKINKSKVEENKERESILLNADKIKGEQLMLVPDGVKLEDELKKFALGNIDNSEKKYDLLYKGIMKLLRTYLPQGKSNKKAREYIYEEKNTFLTRGHRINQYGIRGADSRMAYITDHEALLNEITKWIVDRGTMVDLYNRLRELNIQKGYGAPKV